MSITRYSKLLIFQAVVLLSIPLFLAVVWMPIFILVSSDILMNESFFFLFWDFLKDALNYIFYWFSISFVILSLLLYGWKKSLPFFGLFLLASAIRSIGTAISSAVVLQSFNEDFAGQVGDASFDILFDFLLMTAFSLIIYFIAMRGRTNQAREALLPPESKGFQPVPLQLSILLSVAIYYAVQLFGRIRYDIFYGAATGKQDLAWMIFYYLADLALAVFGFFAVRLILIWLTKKRKA